jgi:UDP-N-acetyl-D-mannosaminuronic acid dehydrogenase
MNELRQKIKNKSVKVVVIGLGYVGLPLACLLAKAGFSVVGINRGKEKVDLVNKGKSPIKGKEPGLDQLLEKVIKSGKLIATTDYSVCKEADVVLIAVETPVDPKKHVPKYEALKAALNSLGKNLKKNSLVIIESTVAPGTMGNIVKPALEKASKKQVGHGFYLGNCPERVTPGRLLLQLENWPRVVGGMDKETANTAAFFYKKFLKGDVDPTSCITAEIVKTEENAFRDTLVAQANALSLLCEHFGANAHEVIGLIKKDPAHKAYLNPGAGVGGHCLPKDGYLKIALARKNIKDKRIRHSVSLTKLTREINDYMPFHMDFLLREGMKESGLSHKKPKITVLGYAYLANSDDTRNSPTESFLRLVGRKDFQTLIHDPFVKMYNSNLENTIKNSDALVLMVAHDMYKKLDLTRIKTLMSNALIIDGRNVFDKEKARKAGFIYKGVGNI